LTLVVYTAFERLYKDKLIYRGERITSWCYECQTVISDLEVDHEQVPGKLWHIAYPATDGSGSVTVATTRPETLLGDTAVAVHPNDARFAGFTGKTLRLPIVGRDIPLITDVRIDREFGTGAVKVTPAHDALDHDIGETHELPSIQVIGLDGKMTAAAGEQFVGKSVVEARLVLTFLPPAALIQEEEYSFCCACSRSKTIIEPLVTKQRFLKVRP
jgi:valyl-tRNA synthetase